MVQSLFKWFTVLTLFASFFTAATFSQASQPDGNLFHPLYISVTEFNHNQKDQVLEISVKLFADDLEHTLKTQYKVGIDLTNPGDQKQVEKLMFDYIQKHLQLKINGKPVHLQFVGYEKEKEAVWCYVQVNEIAKISKLDVKNNLLYDMFNTQIGIMHVNVGGVRKSTKLSNPEENASFGF